MSPSSTKIKIGTRASPLAMAQAFYIRDRLKEIGNLPDDAFEVISYKTTGDQLLNTKLQDIGGKGLFTKEIEQALLNQQIDIAVHSGKDVPTQRQDGLKIAAIPKREDVRDAFISLKYQSLDALPIGATLGTASLRRSAQFLNIRPDLNIKLIRGNVQTRLRKLENAECDATILACAGLKRLNMLNHATEILNTQDFLPAPAQGALILETRTDISPELDIFLNAIHCHDSADAVTAERTLLAALDGNCQTPIAALANVSSEKISLTGALFSENGCKKVEQKISGARKNNKMLGQQLGIAIKKAFGL